MRMKIQRFPFKQASIVAMTLTLQSLNTYTLFDAASIAFIRRNITNIRISTRNLPIEAKRKYGLKREERICPLYNSNKIGTEIHSLF